MSLTNLISLRCSIVWLILDDAKVTTESLRKLVATSSLCEVTQWIAPTADGDEEWVPFRDKLYERIVADQRSDGYWEGQIHPVYVTACNLIMLQLDRGYLHAFTLDRSPKNG